MQARITLAGIILAAAVLTGCEINDSHGVHAERPEVQAAVGTVEQIVRPVLAHWAKEMTEEQEGAVEPTKAVAGVAAFRKRDLLGLVKLVVTVATDTILRFG